MSEAVLGDDDVERFVREGVFLLEGAFPRELADECRQLLWAATGCDEHDPSTWTMPVIRIEGRGDAPFAAAVNTERLHAAFDQLAGRDRWVPRNGIGTFPIRFPVREAPDDEGWHIESTGANANGDAIVDPASRERLLLLLFLFSDVGPDDAPTRVRLGSHNHAARLVCLCHGAFGSSKVSTMAVARTTADPAARRACLMPSLAPPTRPCPVP